jgi:hypothetical protein
MATDAHGRFWIDLIQKTMSGTSCLKSIREVTGSFGALDFDERASVQIRVGRAKRVATKDQGSKRIGF